MGMKNEWRARNRRVVSQRALFIFIAVVGLIGVVLIMAHADVDYNPPVTQAEDTAAEMGRQNDAENQARLDRWKEEQQEMEQAERDRKLEEEIENLKKEQHDNARNAN